MKETVNTFPFLINLQKYKEIHNKLLDKNKYLWYY